MPVLALGQRGSVRVVLHEQVGAERGAQVGENGWLVPAGQAAGQRYRVALVIVDARAAEHGLRDIIAADPGRRADTVRELDQLANPLADTCYRAAGLGLGPDLTGQVGDRAAQVLVPDVQPEHVARVRRDLIQHGRPARNAGPLPGRAHQPRPLDVGQRQGHGRLGEPRQPGQVGTRARAELTDLVEQQQLIHRPDELRARGLASTRLASAQLASARLSAGTGYVLRAV